ncbi:hypothetical protein GGI17_002730 [Coemansia sp. S146]|nr:hypothetical protein GGI17_002730 [Coemansia sp. S146]
MRTLYPLQVLPLHIIELILDYVAGNSRLQFGGVSCGSDEYVRLLLPLATACPSFASSAFSRMFRIYSINLTKKSEKLMTPPSSPTCLSVSGFPVHLYAQKLRIRLDIDIYNGNALKELLCTPYADCIFQKVRSIKFTFSLPPVEEQPTNDVFASPDTAPNISAFVQRIKQMTPMASKVHFSLGFFHNDRPYYPVEPFSDLVMQLSQHAVDIEYRFNYQPAIIGRQLDGLRNLAYDGITVLGCGPLIVQLARRNASTLQSLELSIVMTIDITDIFRNADGSYVQYPCLREFKFGALGMLFLPRLPAFPGAVPFPSLRCLDIRCVYPFSDDMVFRGNAATLESLSLRPNLEVIRILREYRVFTPVSHPKLRQVRFGVKLDSEQGLFATDVERMRFVLSIGPKVPVRTVFDTNIGSALQTVIPVFAEHTCIQVLTLESFHLNLWDAIALIKALPLLSDLHAPFPILGPRPDGVFKHKLPAYVIVNYAPTGIRFRCWSYKSPIDRSSKSTVRCVLLLALVCPNFDYAATDLLCNPLFMAQMKEMISTDGFRSHAARLRRLLFGGARNEIPSVKTILSAEAAALIRGRMQRTGHLE